MKKQILVMVAAIALAAGSAQAQNEKGQMVFGVNAGFGAAKTYISALLTTDEFSAQTATATGGPAIVIGADYGLHKRFSLGIQFATQGIKGTVTDHEFVDASSTVITEDFDYTARRSHISLVPKFHYLVDNDKVDLYSGLRIGRVMWKTTHEAKDPNFTDLDDLSRNSVGLVAFGAKFYFTDNIGANVELNFGPPYFVTFGVAYKLGGED